MREPPFDTETYLRVLNDLKVGVYITDLDGQIVLANRESERITGYPADELVHGRNCRDVLVCKDRTGRALCGLELCPLRRATANGVATDRTELHAVSTRGGDTVPVSVSTSPMFDARRSLIGGIHVFRAARKHVRDLTLAQRIQTSILEAPLPEHDELRFQVVYFPHDLVGGDYYDIRDLGDGLYGVLVADVTGHGIAASLYTLLLKSLVEAASATARRPRELLGKLNTEIERFTLPESFATALYAVIDTVHWEMSYSNAGHPSPLRCRNGVPDLDPLVGRSFPLGMFSDGEYGESRIQLEPGETVLLYTDGLTEMFVECEPPRSQRELEAIVCQELRKEQGVDLERLYRRVLDTSCCITSPDDVLLLSVHRSPA